MRARGPESFWIVNEMAYAYIVQEGMGRHPYARDWQGEATNLSTQRAVMSEIMSEMRVR
jgi:hypothetical protein